MNSPLTHRISKQFNKKYNEFTSLLPERLNYHNLLKKAYTLKFRPLTFSE